MKESTVEANMISVDSEVNLTTPLYLLSTIVDNFGNEEVEAEISEVCDYVTDSIRFNNITIIQSLLSEISNVLETTKKDIKNRVDVSFYNNSKPRVHKKEEKRVSNSIKAVY